MIIDVKFKKGDRVYFMYKEKPCNSKVKGIYVDYKESYHEYNHTIIKYNVEVLGDSIDMYEHLLFSTPMELRDSIFPPGKLEDWYERQKETDEANQKVDSL